MTSSASDPLDRRSPLAGPGAPAAPGVTAAVPDGPSGTAVSRHGRVWRWVSFEPSWRDPCATNSCQRVVLCRICGTVLGETRDPVDALLIARRHRRTVRR